MSKIIIFIISSTAFSMKFKKKLFSFEYLIHKFIVKLLFLLTVESRYYFLDLEKDMSI